MSRIIFTTILVGLILLMEVSQGVFGQQTSVDPSNPQLQAWELGTNLARAGFGKLTNDRTEEYVMLATNRANELQIRLPDLPEKVIDKARKRFDYRDAAKEDFEKAMVAFFQTDAGWMLAKDIESQSGRVAAQLFRWAVTVETSKFVRLKGLAPDSAIQNRLKQVVKECGLPESLATPLVEAAESRNVNQIYSAVKTVEKRMRYLLTEIRPNGRPDSDISRFDIDHQILEAKKRQLAERTEADFAKALEGKTNAEEKTDELLRKLHLYSGNDEHGVFSKHLRTVGAASLPSICRKLLEKDKQVIIRYNQNPFVALNVVLFQEEVKNVRNGVSADSRRLFDAACVPELVRELQDPRTEEGALFALKYFSLATNAAIAPQLLLLRDGLKSEAELKSADETLADLCLMHVKRAFRNIDDFVLRERSLNLKEELAAEYVFIKAYMPVLEQVARKAVELAASEQLNASFKAKQAFVQGLLEATEPDTPEKAAHKRAVSVWTKVVGEVEATIH